MKKTVSMLLLASLFIFAGCENEMGAGGASMTQDTSMTARYDDDNMSFDVPEAWQKNFKAVTRQAGSSGDTYPQTEFYYTEGDRDIRMMTIGKFTREQWDKMKDNGKVSNNTLFGESPDKKHVYSIYFEDHDYIEDSKLRDALGKLKGEAEMLKDKMKFK